MRFASILLLLAVASGDAPAMAMPPALAVPGGTLRVTQRGAATVLSISRGRHTTRTVLPRDDGIYPGSLDATTLVGVIPGRVLVLLSDYDSRPNGGSHACGAGTETMLRVVALRPAPRQVFRQLVASCWSSIEIGDVAWDGRTRELTVERTTFDSGAGHRRTRYRIDPDGTVATLGVESLP